MSIYGITFSPTGGTDKVAEIILKKSGQKYERISLLDCETEYKQIHFEEDDICVIAIPAYGGRIPTAAAERFSMLKANGTKCVLVAVYGNREFEDTLIEMKDIAKACGFHPVAAVAGIAEHSIMPQFANGRPDEDDKKVLEAYAERIWKNIFSGEAWAEVQVPGNEEYRKFGGVSMKPKVRGKCIKCGKCAAQCPTGAIDRENPRKTDGKKCITCMRCVKICPTGARRLDELMLFVASQGLKKSASGRKENQLFISNEEE